MNAAQLKQLLDTSKSELLADGWIHEFTVMSGKTTDFKYGLFFVKNGIKFYLNKDTCAVGWTGPEMARACKSLFN